MATQETKEHVHNALDTFNRQVTKNISFAVSVGQDITELVNQINNQLENSFYITFYSPEHLYIWRKNEGIKVSILTQDKELQIHSVRTGDTGQPCSVSPSDVTNHSFISDGLSEIAKKIANLAGYDPKLVQGFKVEKTPTIPSVDPNLPKDKPLIPKNI